MKVQNQTDTSTIKKKIILSWKLLRPEFLGYTSMQTYHGLQDTSEFSVGEPEAVYLPSVHGESH